MKLAFPFSNALAAFALALLPVASHAEDPNTAYGSNALIVSPAGGNSAFGYNVLGSNTSGTTNTGAGDYTLSFNTTGSSLTAVGAFALRYNLTGNSNNAFGAFALIGDRFESGNNNSGNDNSAAGYFALAGNSTGVENTACGNYALQKNTSGYYNTAVGFSALNSNLGGTENTAVGFSALYLNTSGSYNTAVGGQSLYHNTNGVYNVAVGFNSLSGNTTGSYNAALGDQSLSSNTTGINNTALGRDALGTNTTGNDNTAIGLNALAANKSGNTNVAIGFLAGDALSTGSNNIDIANPGVAGESHTIRIGQQGTQTATFVAGVFGATSASGVRVQVNSKGELGTLTSSRKFKTDIQDIGAASDRLLSLRPVSYRYKKEVDTQNIPQFGLIAEEVADVNPDLVARDDSGEIYTVRYQAVNALLLDAFLKYHQGLAKAGDGANTQDEELQEQEREIEARDWTIARQKQEIEALARRMTVLAAKLEKSSRPVPAKETVAAR